MTKQFMYLIARMNTRLRPMDRGELYEDPLDEMLQEKGYGEVSGGGSQLGDRNEIVFCDIEISLNNYSAESAEVVQQIKTKLESLGAPKGSKLINVSDETEIEFGINEGLALYLNGTELPKQVYQDCDVNFLITELQKALGEKGSMHSYWQGPQETALYFYGASFEEMSLLMGELVSTYPLCQLSRVVKLPSRIAV